MSPAIQTIPLFPLDVVLFPGMVLPLHIFEPRYRKMVRDCIANGEPFGLLWAEEEPLQAQQDRPLVGTTALITSVEALEEGRFNISTLGGERFQVRGFSYDEPYLVGYVEPYPARDDESVEAERSRPVLLRLLRRYVSLLDKIADNPILLEDIPDDLTQLAYLVAVYYQCQNWRKQELLAIESLEALLRREIELLRVEIPLVEQALRYQSLGQMPPFIASTLAIHGLS